VWYSFTQFAYAGLSMAAFLGALQTLAGGLITAATKVSAGTTATTTAATGAAATGTIFAALPMAVIGGLLLVGLGCAYMAQREATELQVVKDEHAACQNAKQINTGLSQNIEHSQNCRKDGKKWTQAIDAQEQAMQARI
jgi:hypothetical protein